MFWEIITNKPRYRAFWALQDVSFDVKRGEVVGVIGRNGAGKSTLLKILAGTLDKTSGHIEINGKVSAILELGTGFHPEYTGRENIYMGCMYLGMSKEVISRKIDSIIEFSELESFIDQPFKTYSSGMQARLVFSTAVSVEPEIFIIDEALAAGDALFQEKCFRRIRQIVKSGTTVFFVTHSLGLVYDLCHSCILFSEGRMLMKDEPRIVGYEYEKILANDRQMRELNSSKVVLDVSNTKEKDVHELNNQEIKEKNSVSGKVITAEGEVKLKQDLKAEVISFEILNENGISVKTLFHGDNYSIRVKAICRTDLNNLSISFRIEQVSGLVVYGTSTILFNKNIKGHKGDLICVDFFLPCLLQAGQYLLGGGVSEMLGESKFNVLHIVRGALDFEVSGNTRFQGVINMQSNILQVKHSNGT
jgi:ABC-type polysaccharide/polyol phosphate transport system ATPase subunit